MFNFSRPDLVKGVLLFILGFFIVWLHDRFSMINWLYIGLVAISYTLYEVLRDKIPNKWKYHVLNRSFIILIVTLLGGFFASDNNLKQALFTFSSVYLGFWLNEQIKIQEERRRLKFFLGMIWQELRYNRVLLETLKGNYKFFMDDEKNLEIMYLKYSSINAHAGFLKSSIYDAFVSSGVITGLKKDDIFNDITSAYTNIRFLQLALGIVLSDFTIKLKIHNAELIKTGTDKYSNQILKDLCVKIKDNAGKELAISYRAINKAIDKVDAYLNTLIVKSDAEKQSDSDLLEEDWTFIEGILRKSPEKIPQDIFVNE